MTEVTELQKPVVSLYVDGGPDFNPKHAINFLAFGRLWKDRGLDCLIATCHSPGHSAYNPVEHAWSPLARALTGVTLPNHLPGEEPPHQQNVDAEEQQRKESVVFDQAIDTLCGYWNGLTYDSFQVSARKVRCVDTEPACTDHDLLSRFTKASEKAVGEDEDLQTVLSLLKFLSQHAARSTYQTLFLKCERTDCEHCSQHPIRATNAIGFLRRSGGRLFTPAPSPVDHGHYLTFLESCTQAKLGKAALPLDGGLPSGEPSRCQYGCQYAFLSKRDSDRHVRLVHSHEFKQDQKKRRAERKEEGPAEKRPTHICTFSGCAMAFTSTKRATTMSSSEGGQRSLNSAQQEEQLDSPGHVFPHSRTCE